MRSILAACLSFFSLACGACAYRLPVSYPGSSASETIDIRVAQDQIEKVASGIRQDAMKASRHGFISVMTQPDYQGRAQTVEAQTDVYVAALDDAQRKAQAIAAREHVMLGPVESIQEILGNIGPISTLKGAMPLSVGVHVSPNQPVMLFVAFRLGSLDQQTDVPHVIAVYGLASPRIGPQYGAQGVPKIIEINLNDGGKTAAAAMDALLQDDKLVRDALAKMSVPQSAVTVERTQTTQQ